MSRFLTFRLASQTYALRSEAVLEVIRVPALARVPQAPAALRGIANLRGSILPVAGLREMLGFEPAVDVSSARAIVLDLGAPMAIVVDSVATLEPADQIDTGQNALAAEGEERLLGAFMTEARQVAKILDIDALLERAFTGRARARHARQTAPPRALPAHEASAAPTEALVTFEVAGQEFALSIDAVQEILPAPASVTAVARAEAAVLGITSVRGHLLPLLSLRTLLGLGAGTPAGDRQKVIVAKIGGAQVGLVADNARAIVAADPDLVEAVPPVLAARTGGESRITAVYRGEQGRRLISILSPEQLFKEDVMRRLASTAAPVVEAAAEPSSTSGPQSIFLVFRLGGDEFGLPIDSVVEVAQVPEQITRVPRTPKFLEGVVNLRGEVLPVVDQRRRFDMPKLGNTDGRRLVVTRTDRHRAGLIVDSVSDVLRASADQIQPPPDLTESTSRLVRGVINLGRSGRMVLLLDPAELLTRAEQGLLDTFQKKKNRQVGA